MPAYMIIEIQVLDAEVYGRYVESVREVVESFGGRYLARGGKITPISGQWRPERVILIEFDNLDQVHACFRSAEYARLGPLREQSAISRAIVVEGCAEEKPGMKTSEHSQELEIDSEVAIRPLTDADFEAIHSIINDAARAYKGVIPGDRWHEPYMPREELRHEIESGVRFWGYEENGELLGVMGIQDVQDVTLVRHAYVRTASRRQGIGGTLLRELRKLAARPVLVGTWAAATWAIRFYERHGFRQVSEEEKNRLLARYWTIPDRQMETSVVLTDSN